MILHIGIRHIVLTDSCIPPNLLMYAIINGKTATGFEGTLHMIVEPKIRNNICLTSHPLGCEMQVKEQIASVRSRGELEGPKRVLVIGSSNGYGLAAWIVAAFASGAATVGVSFEKPGTEKRPGTAGWYNEAAFQREAEKASLSAWSINGDAFSDEIKSKTVGLIKENLGEVDLVVYSIASPRRMDPLTGNLYSSVIKPIGKSYTSKMLDFSSGLISEMTLEPASQEEIEHTIKVMGGEDWSIWIEAMDRAGLLAERFLTVAFSYRGPALTNPIYRDGTIGKAKEHLEATAEKMNMRLSKRGGRALISVNKALVTRASAVIPGVPLYISLLYKVMKEKGIHEGCIQQMERLFRHFLYTRKPKPPDKEGRIRLDDLEMRSDVQDEVTRLWEEVSNQNLEELSDIKGFRDEFLRHHGFGMEGVDYTADVELSIP